MYVQRLLAINMASFAALGTVLLALGEQNATLSVVAVLAAMAAVWITDILGVFRLNRRITNVAVLLAVLRSLWELFQIQGSAQVMAIANLLAYVMIILLFQEKDFRTWWHIALLSLLQVAASATFFQGIWFAPLLLVYFFLGLSAMALLFLHHERTHYHQVRHHPIVPRQTRTVSERLGVNWRRLGKIVLATFVVGPISLFLDYGETDDKRRRSRRRRPRDLSASRWPLIYEETEFTGSADNLGGRAGIGAEFYRHLAGLIPGTLVVAAVLFMLIPRMGRFEFAPFRFASGSASQGSPGIRTTGFSDTVQLGAEGNLKEDPEEVLQIRFLEPGTEKVHPMRGKVYLRGALLNCYDRGRWDWQWPSFGRSWTQPVEPGRSRPGLVQQRISIRPFGRRELLCVWPFVAVKSDQRLRLDVINRRLLRSDYRRDAAAPFDLGTYAVVDGRQVDLTPSAAGIELEREQLLDLPTDDLPGLIKTAQDWIDKSGLDETQVVERARYLESMFTETEKFAYSLDGQLREPEVDPIEDFITSEPSVGHCVYFATALTLMLRSQGIPARMVNGFVTSEYDSEGGFYRVRHRDAHSWVEAYIPEESLPASRPFGRDDVNWSRGGWFRLDPTPAREAAAAPRNFVASMEDWMEWIEGAWISYVVQMNRARQQDAVYDPLKSLALKLKEAMIDAEMWRGLWKQIAGLPRRLHSLLADAGWFSWLGATFLLGTLGFGYLAYRLFRWSLWLIARLLPNGRLQPGRRSRIAFYRRLETVLARHGLNRRAGQTHREFALVAGRHLANGDDRQAQSAALLVTDAFYEVRFGGGSLDSLRMQRVEQALCNLEQAASGRPVEWPHP
ncbi:MAG: DUF3488 domain-containing transglutaminase family protein [Planctomycetaceae bacterium]|nr:DUF3488 domain-containing transglutaminase family protein [Planctomycetaceae bacterium]